jgi:hypothetical protein
VCYMQIPYDDPDRLDPERKGKAPVVAFRLLRADAARLAELAPRYGGNRSLVVREALRLGLDQLERDTVPP